MFTCSRLRIVLIMSLATILCTSIRIARAKEKTEPVTVRCAVIGGMMDTGFWPALVRRFEASHDHRIEVVAEGPKRVISRAFVAGEADLITMHAGDTIINLVADGYGVDPQPWAKNDLVLVGPASDPAGIRGMTDAVQAVRKIVRTKSNLLINRSLGAQGVLLRLMAAGGVEMDPRHTVLLLDDKNRQMLLRASKEHAYTVVGRVPFLNGKIPNRDLVIMVQGDRRLRRPYVVVAADPARVPKPRAAAARQLARYLRAPATQAWIAQYGRGKLDERPLFFPVTVCAGSPGQPEYDAIYGSGSKTLIVATGSPG